MGKLLCGVDGSGHAARAVERAVELAAALDADLAFVVVNGAVAGSGGVVIETWSEAEAGAILEAAARQARSRGVRAELVLTSGRDIPAAILKCADEIGADHIVTGAGTASRLGRLLLGSVAQGVAAQAPCTVTIAR